MRAPLRGTSALALGSVTNAVLAYVFFTMVTRALGAEAAAPVSVLWTYWSFAAAALTFPLQHWITRTVTASRSEVGVRTALPVVIAAVTVTAAVSGGLAWLARDSLFHRDDPWFPLLVSGVTLGSGFVGVVRGGLSARGRFGSVGLALAGENALRCVAALALIVASVTSPLAFGGCMVLGSAVGLLWPASVRFSDLGPAAPEESAFGFLGPAASGQLIGQAVLTGGPVLLALRGGTPAAVTALFAGLALFRAPYTLAVGLVSQLTGRLTALVVERRQAELRRVQLSVWAGAALATVVAGVLGAWVGPWLLRTIFGAQVILSRPVAALIAAGSAVALANLVQTVALLAHNRSGAVTRAWLFGLAAGAAVVLLVQVGPLDQTAMAFVATEVVAFVGFAVEGLRGVRRLAQPEPGRTAAVSPS